MVELTGIQGHFTRLPWFDLVIADHHFKLTTVMWQIDPEFLSTLSEIHVRGSQREADNKILFIEIPRNSVEILSNTCLYNIRETFLTYWGYLLAVNLLIYLETWSLKRANNVPKLPGVDYVAKNWALAMMSKALLLVQFWSITIVVERANDDCC